MNNLINTRNLAISSLIATAISTIMKQESLTQIDWVAIGTLSGAAISQLIVDLRNGKIISVKDLLQAVDDLRNKSKFDEAGLVSHVQITEDLIPWLVRAYKCKNPFYIIDCETNLLEWTNKPGALDIGLSPKGKIPTRDMKLYWRENDLDLLNEKLSHLPIINGTGKPMVHEYEAAFSTPIDWRHSNACFRLIQLNDGSIKRVSQNIGNRKIKLPMDRRIILQDYLQRHLEED